MVCCPLNAVCCVLFAACDVSCVARSVLFAVCWFYACCVLLGLCSLLLFVV